MKIQINKHPNITELESFFEEVFDETNDNQNFDESSSQSLKEWFDIEEFEKYLHHGVLIEARDSDQLIGAIFIGKQHPLSWPDGKKVEVFILGVSQHFRQKKVGSQLLTEAEQAAKEMGAQTIIINSHVLLTTARKFYLRNGYSEIGILKNYYENGDAVFLTKRIA